MRTLCRRLVLSFALVVAALSGAAHAAEPINTLEKKGLFGYKASGVAIRGYDTVAYWTQGQPVEGDEAITADYMGATWRFASEAHRDLFTAEPAKYAPQYGGYCAYGVAQDSLVKIEPEDWTILDDKLYLNYDDGVQSRWEGDIPGFIMAADEKFDGLLQAD